MNSFFGVGIVIGIAGLISVLISLWIFPNPNSKNNNIDPTDDW